MNKNKQDTVIAWGIAQRFYVLMLRPGWHVKINFPAEAPVWYTHREIERRFRPAWEVEPICPN